MAPESLEALKAEACVALVLDEVEVAEGGSSLDCWTLYGVVSQSLL